MPKRAKSVPNPQTEVGGNRGKNTQIPRIQVFVSMMRVEGGATAKVLAAATGWQVHSVRGFISGVLKKRPDIVVHTERVEGVTRYRLTDSPAGIP